MGELQFAKSFLTTLDSKSNKYQPDHVFDPGTFGLRTPYTLPRLSHPPHPQPPKSGKPTEPAPGSTAVGFTLTAILKSTKNPNMSITLPDLPLSTPIHALKEQVQKHLGGQNAVNFEKIKILFNKKPVPASKTTVAEVLDGTPEMKEREVEFGVMVIGGAADPPIKTSTSGSGAAAVETGAAPMEGVEKTTIRQAVLEQEDFWTDLEGFLEQKLEDKDEAVKLKDIFRAAYKTSTIMGGSLEAFALYCKLGNDIPPVLRNEMEKEKRLALATERKIDKTDGDGAVTPVSTASVDTSPSQGTGKA